MIGADLIYGVKSHPQDVMDRLGAKVVKCEAYPIGDCWVFRIENELPVVPGYLHEMPDSFKFSDEKSEQSWPKDPPMYKPDGTLTDYGVYCETGQLPAKE